MEQHVADQGGEKWSRRARHDGMQMQWTLNEVERRVEWCGLKQTGASRSQERCLVGAREWITVE